MFDIGWTELMLIGIVALIVIGPKDLPDMFRTLGRFTAKAKGMAREFSRAMESAADEAGVKDVAKDLRNATSAKSMGLDAVKDAAKKFEAWDPVKALKEKPEIKPDPAAAPPATPPAPKGPATQALAEAQAAKREALKASVAETKAAVKPEATASKPAPKAAPKSAPKSAAQPKAAVPKLAPKPRKAAAKKGDA